MKYRFAVALAIYVCTLISVACADDSVRPFHIAVEEKALVDLRQRINATRWPDKETVGDASQGAQLAQLQALVRYWGTDYDWRKAQAQLNALPQFVTTIDGVDIHFIWVRSPAPNALPMIMTHGWPGSVFEFIKVIGPLSDPVAHGGNAADAFDLVIPSIPGYGFSGKPGGTGWDPDHIAQVWAQLMQRLGYQQYVAQGGDWGGPITGAMARQAPAGLRGIHLNLPATIPPEAGAALAIAGPAPAQFNPQERQTYEAVATLIKQGNLAYSAMMAARPQTIGYGVTDSPVALAAFLLVHPGFVKWTYGTDAQQLPTRDQVLDDITLYWLTNSGASSARLYWENKGRSPLSSTAQKTSEISLPVAITVFPEDVYCPPESWARRAYRNLIYFHQAEKGGHFAAWEQPQLFTEELRTAFRSLR
ncbi:epoxide hydrolase [Pseudomonas sp. PCH199]|uniref:epoxide hydrolase family protein n=1 Tax=unclassified Pseudomonas TaxID=196821 RepID=UPI000BCAED04|nr:MULTISPECIES: epoxide hydrolase family protein [unclassified Pseudomonas]MCW8278537.1 epoxide hydrolase [Pseudomonas sp. PCH199]PAM81327.1 multidrug MFS transporter [Pseudomonas sp. ERMR1:02]